MNLPVHLALILVQALFASLAIAGKVVLREFPPMGLVLVRVGGAALLLGLGNLLWRGRWIRDRADLRRLAFLSLLGVVANQGLFLIGLRHTTATNATIIVATIPVFTVLYSLLGRREAPSFLKLAGIALAAAGSVWLIGPDRIALEREKALGNAIILAGMACYGWYLVQSKELLRRYDPITVSIYVMAFATLFTLPLGAWAMARTDLAAVRPSTWAWIAYIVLFPTIVTYFLNIWALSRVSSNLVAAYIYLQPVFTAAVAPMALEGEALTGRALGAGLAIFAGLACVILGERRQQGQVPVGAVVGE
jgi:drug/metabolite transporter (DMT)-like permease